MNREMPRTKTETVSLEPELAEALEHVVVLFRSTPEFAANPLIIARADGIRLEDTAGRTFIDGVSGASNVVNIGHNNQRVIAATKAQLDRVAFAAPAHATTLPALELVKLLGEITPGDLNTIQLLSGGSEATEAAIKLARQYHRQTGNPQKYKIISRYGAYHGVTLGALSATGVSKVKQAFEPLLEGFIHVPQPYRYRCLFCAQLPGCNLNCARTIEETIEAEGPASVAAILVEPISNFAGIVPPPDGYFGLLREICDRHNILLMLDEVVTGFGRTGKLFGAETVQAEPDVMCLGKGISSGYAPLAALAISDRVAQAFWGTPEDHVEFMSGHTYGGSPVACAAGIANIREILDRQLVENAFRQGEYLRARLQELAEFGVIGEIRGRGLMNAVEFVRDPATRQRFPNTIAIGVKVGEAALRRGLMLRPESHWIGLYPPLISTQSDIDEIVAILREAIAETLATLPPATSH